MPENVNIRFYVCNIAGGTMLFIGWLNCRLVTLFDGVGT